MENYQFTDFMRYSRVKGEVEANGRTINYIREPISKHEDWLTKNEDNLWTKYYETGACFDTDYEDFCEMQALRGKTG